MGQESQRAADEDSEADEGRDHFDAEPTERQKATALADEKELRDERKAIAKLKKEEQKEKTEQQRERRL